MRLNSRLQSWLGTLLILTGVSLGLILSASVTWGESEAGLYSSYNGDRHLDVKCPLMLAPDETGTITAKVTNLINEDITPTVSTQISHAGMPRATDQIVPLKPNESETLEWSVDSSDVVYKHLILVNILQLRYRDNPSMLGSCGILLFSLFGLSGLGTFGLVMAASLIAMSCGAILWVQAHKPLDDRSSSLGRAGLTLITITVLALLSLFPRWWGLTLVLDALIALVIGVIFTEFVLFSGKHQS